MQPVTALQCKSLLELMSVQLVLWCQEAHSCPEQELLPWQAAHPLGRVTWA